jgi:low temperature requirement protein LtrA
MQPGGGDHGSPSHLPAAASVGWLELFYDLVMVAATIVFSHSLAHEPSWEHGGWTAAMFSLLWWAWLLTTLNINADPREDAVRRIMIFAQMFLVVMLTVVGGHIIDPRQDLVGLLYGALLLSVAALYERTRRAEPALGGFARRRRDLLFVAGLLVMISSPLPVAPEVVCWVVASVLIVAPVVSGRLDRGIDRPAVNRDHLVERMAALTTVVFGEAFVTVAVTSTTRHLQGVNFIVLGLEFVVVFSIWLAYFDDIAVAGMPEPSRAQRAWMILHLPLDLAIVGMAVGMGGFLRLAASAHPDTSDVIVLTLPLVIVFVVLAAIGVVSPRRPRRWLVVLRLATAVLLVLVGLAVWEVKGMPIEAEAALYGVIVLAHLFAATRLRARTTVPGSQNLPDAQKLPASPNLPASQNP